MPHPFNVKCNLFAATRLEQTYALRSIAVPFSSLHLIDYIMKVDFEHFTEKIRSKTVLTGKIEHFNIENKTIQFIKQSEIGSVVVEWLLLWNIFDPLHHL